MIAPQARPVFALLSAVNVMAWLFAIVGFAHRYLTMRPAFLSEATEAVYPFYLIHQTVTVVAVYGPAEAWARHRSPGFICGCRGDLRRDLADLRRAGAPMALDPAAVRNEGSPARIGRQSLPAARQAYKYPRGRPATEGFMTDIVIASAARTPIGSFNGAFGAVPAHDLGKAAIKGALERAKVKPEEVDEVILGQILTGGQGQNPARQAAVNSGIPVEKTALGINQLCGSGLRAVAFGWQAIRNGDASIMVVGGQESMSQAPHAAHLRDGTKMGELKMVDTMLKDGLWDAFHGYHMGNTAENVAQKFQITRAEQDALRGLVAEQGRGGPEVRPLQGRDRPGDDQDPQGRRRRRHRRVPAPRHDGRGAGQAASGLHQGRRLGHRRQRLGHQRRRRGAGADER